MRKLFNLLTIAAAVTAAAILNSCKTEETPAEDATVEIKVTATSEQDISFEVGFENAASLYYAFGKQDMIESAEYKELGTTENPASVTESGLEENTEYVIRAYALNADGKKSPVAEETAKTSEEATIKAEIISCTSYSVTFKLSPVNAVSYSYAVVESSEDLETVALENKAESSSEQEFTVDGLEANTQYSVVASAVNASGNEGERSFRSFRTEIEPVIEVTEIIPESNQASIKLKRTDCPEYAYAYAKKGDPQPEKAAFTKTNAEELIISGLEPLTEYMFYAFGINGKGYESENIISEGFTTLEYVQKAFEINVSDITSTNAGIAVHIDKEKYSKFYFTLAETNKIGDISAWDWESKIAAPSVMLAILSYDSDMEFTLREWGNSDTPLVPGGLYMIGGVPETIDGKLDTTAAIWTSAQLPEPVFGESDVTCEIVQNSISMTSFGFRVTSQSPEIESFYMMESAGDLSADTEKLQSETLRNVIVRKALRNFDTDTVRNYLSAGTTYTFILVPKDKDGKLGNIVTKVITTTDVYYEGDARMEASLGSITQNKAVFNVSKGENTEQIAYYFTQKNAYYNEENFLKSLKVNNRNMVPQEGEFAFENLEPNTEYVFGFAPLDADGVAGECKIFTESTLGYEFNGNTQAKVDVQVLSLTTVFEGRTWYAKIKATPNEYVKEYYLKANVSSSTTDDKFADNCMKGLSSYPKYTGEHTFEGTSGQGEVVSTNAWIWVLAVDLDGNLVPIAKTKVDGTWTE